MALLHARCAPLAAGPRRSATASPHAAPAAALLSAWPRHARGHATPRPSRRLRPCAALDAGSGAAGWQIYTALGLTASSFLATFFVAPRFREQFKEAEPWEAIYPVLVKQGVSPIAPSEAAKRRGAVLLDVRLPDAVAARRVPRAVAVPLYVPIQNYDVFSNIRRVAFAFFGIAGTELNPGFLAGVEAATKGNKGAELVVMCERGGSLENRPMMKFGFQSRSLKALHSLRTAGFRNVRHLTGGLTAWAADGLPVEDGQE